MTKEVADTTTVEAFVASASELFKMAIAELPPDTQGAIAAAVNAAGAVVEWRLSVPPGQIEIALIDQKGTREVIGQLWLGPAGRPS